MTDSTVSTSPALTGRSRRRLSPVGSLAVVAVLALFAAGCGDDTADGTADDPASTSTSTSPSAPDSSSSAPTSSAPASPSATATDMPTSVPTMDPAVVKAAQAALKDKFPALVPTEVLEGWTVVAATYDKKISTWTVSMTDATGAGVELTQAETGVADLVATVMGDGATKNGSVDLAAYGIGTWTVYDGADQSGIAKKFSSTAAVITATDSETAAELAKTLVAAEDGGVPDAG